MLLFAIILALTFISGFILPWWVCAIIAFAAALLIRTKGSAFLCGFSAVAVAWLGLALLKTLPNENILAQRMAKLFHLPNWLLLLAVTIIIGGLVGGFSALTGVLFRKAFITKKA
ncbi:hypothetical protein EOD41_19835 [Mucilaginibacter limnophilus]|uniref:Uncharacterized protein n=1 Tax=Mucilaginibacter limnophilus TaxID=1932778 RepID=A0A3S2ULM7_9SPHI|nr:hypothetical protein [Mucilaginibacter limnophilus]RVT96564.1 hypothetical protein EOD41_19835 [Mucilaginibacter limnophilus]